jgi:hypothetical protein
MLKYNIFNIIDMKTRILFILTILLFITIIINRRKNSFKNYKKVIQKKDTKEKKSINWKFFYNVVKENFLGDTKIKEEKKGFDKNTIITPMYDDNNKSIAKKLQFKKFISPILNQKVNKKIIEKFSEYNIDKDIKLDFIKCKYNNDINKKFNILSKDKKNVLDKLDYRVYRVIENFHHDTTDIIVNKCSKPDKKNLYYYLNTKMDEINNDYLSITYNKIVIFNKSDINIKYLINIPRGNFIKIHYDNNIKNIYLRKDMKKINLDIFTIENIRKIQIFGIQNKFNIINNHNKFTNTPLLIFKDSLIDGLIEVLEASENFNFKFYKGDTFIKSNKINYIPFDSMYTIDSRYSFYIENNNKKVIINNLNDLEINENMLFKLLRNDSFVGNNSIID